MSSLPKSNNNPEVRHLPGMLRILSPGTLGSFSRSVARRLQAMALGAAALVMLSVSAPAQATITVFWSAGANCLGSNNATFTPGGAAQQVTLCLSTTETATEQTCGYSVRVRSASAGEAGRFHVTNSVLGGNFPDPNNTGITYPVPIDAFPGTLDFGGTFGALVPVPVGANQILNTLTIAPQANATNASYVISTTTFTSLALDTDGTCGSAVDYAVPQTDFTFNLASYTVTPSAVGNGTIAPATPVTVNHGATTSFTVTPSANHTASIGGSCPAGSLVGNTYTTGVIVGNCTVTATFNINTYPVTGVASPAAGGSVSCTSPVNHGSTTTCAIATNPGYTLTGATSNTCAGSLSGNTFTTGAVTSACTVTATFTQNTYAVTGVASPTAGGSVSCTSPVTHGNTTTCAITTNAGYTLNGATSNTCAGALSGNTFTTGAVTSACTVTATFTQITYPVTGVANPVAGGSVNCTSPVNHGSTTTCAITTNPGYTLNGATSNTCAGSLSGSTFTTGAVTSACTVTANFVAHITYNLVLEGAQEVPANISTGTGSGTAVVDTVNNTIVLNVTFNGIGALTGAHLHGPATRGVNNGVKIGLTDIISPITETLTYLQADEADILAGNWYLNLHTAAFTGGELRAQLDNLGPANKTLTVSVTGNGSVTSTPAGINCPGDCSESYAHNTVVNLTATPVANNSFSGWTGACTGTGACAVTMDFLKSVTATFTLNSYAVTGVASPVAGGSVNCTSPVNHGSTTTCAITTNPGYTLNGATSNTCAGTLSGNTFTTGAVTSACTVTATFTQITYPVTGVASPVAGGSVNCTSPVNHGSTTTCAITTNAGYTLNGATSNTCAGSLSGSTFTTGAVTSACTVTATFANIFALDSIRSRKSHASTEYDILINASTPLAGSVDVEPRAIGTGHQIVFRFTTPVTQSGSATTTVGSATAAINPNNANEVIVTLTSVPDNTRLTVGLNDVSGNTASDFSASIGFLVGDVTNTRTVNAADIAVVKVRQSATVNATNFRFDLNASGQINSADITTVKARTGLTIP
jgi:CHRD domain/Divergent InlB B-repeat domain